MTRNRRFEYKQRKGDKDAEYKVVVDWDVGLGLGPAILTIKLWHVFDAWWKPNVTQEADMAGTFLYTYKNKHDSKDVSLSKTIRVMNSGFEWTSDRGHQPVGAEIKVNVKGEGLEWNIDATC